MIDHKKDRVRRGNEPSVPGWTVYVAPKSTKAVYARDQLRAYVYVGFNKHGGEQCVSVHVYDRTCATNGQTTMQTYVYGFNGKIVHNTDCNYRQFEVIARALLEHTCGQ